MAIVTYSYYTDTYLGESVATADFPKYELRAEQLINQVCRGQYPALLSKLEAGGHTAAATALTEAYSNAICAQVDYFAANGLLATVTGQTGQSFTVGKVSVGGSGASDSFSTRGAAMISPMATAFLEQTGLLSRVVSAPVDPYAPFPMGVW